MPDKNYYKTLGVARDATEKDIKRAYRRLARKHHPDVNPGDKGAEQKFKEISEAYEVLSDKDKRAKYDQFGHLGDAWRRVQQGPPGGGPGAPGGFTWQTADFGDAREGAPGFGDIFEMFFGAGPAHAGGRARAGGVKGEDLQHDVDITLEEAANGTQRTVVVNMPKGKVKRLDVRIPAGVKDGAKVRLSGEGGPGPGGGPAGDLYVIPHIRPHRWFQRDGDDLTVEVPVTFPEAALGAEVEVPTLWGKVKLTVPPGSSSGRKLRLGGMGMPKLRGGEKGDLYVKLKIVAPKSVTKEERELIEQLARLRQDNPRQF